MYPIRAVENAIIRRIHAARLPYLRFVGSYGGELMGEWQTVYRAVPAVWVAFDGADAGRALNTARTRWESVLRFSTVCASHSPRAEAARTGGPATAGALDMLADVAALTALYDCGLDGVGLLEPGRIRSLFAAAVQGQSLAVFAQDWQCRVQVRFRAPCERPLPAPGTASGPDSGADSGRPSGSYLPPEGVRLPGLAHAEDAGPLPPLEGLALRYWCKPPQDPATDAPLLEDRLTLNIRL